MGIVKVNKKVHVTWRDQSTENVLQIRSWAVDDTGRQVGGGHHTRKSPKSFFMIFALTFETINHFILSIQSFDNLRSIFFHVILAMPCHSAARIVMLKCNCCLETNLVYFHQLFVYIVGVKSFYVLYFMYSTLRPVYLTLLMVQSGWSSLSSVHTTTENWEVNAPTYTDLPTQPQ